MGTPLEECQAEFWELSGADKLLDTNGFSFSLDKLFSDELLDSNGFGPSFEQLDGYGREIFVQLNLVC